MGVGWDGVVENGQFDPSQTPQGDPRVLPPSSTIKSASLYIEPIQPALNYLPMLIVIGLIPLLHLAGVGWGLGGIGSW